MSIPLDRSEKSECKPAALSNLEAPPVFYFRPATPRDTRKFRNICEIEGIRLHSTADLRAAIKHALGQLWDAESFEIEMPRVQGIWDTLDHNEKKKDDQVAIDDTEMAALNALMAQVYDAAPAIRKMQVENVTYFEDAPKLAIGLFLTGWRNLDVRMRKEAGTFPLPVIDEIETALGKAEDAVGAEGIEVVTKGEAFAQLALHAFSLMSLTETEAGNSASPSAPGSPPNTSSQTVSAQQTANGGFRKSARSRTTRTAA